MKAKKAKKVVKAKKPKKVVKAKEDIDHNDEKQLTKEQQDLFNRVTQSGILSF